MSFSQYCISLCRHITSITNLILNQILTFSVTLLATEAFTKVQSQQGPQEQHFHYHFINCDCQHWL